MVCYGNHLVGNPIVCPNQPPPPLTVDAQLAIHKLVASWPSVKNRVASLIWKSVGRYNQYISFRDWLSTWKHCLLGEDPTGCLVSKISSYLERRIYWSRPARGHCRKAECLSWAGCSLPSVGSTQDSPYTLGPSHRSNTYSDTWKKKVSSFSLLIPKSITDTMLIGYL